MVIRLSAELHLNDMQTLLQLLDSDPRVSFTPQPVVPSGDMRSSWRVALLLVILHRCYGKSATVEQLHAFGWAILAEPERQTLVAGLAGNVQPDEILIRFDPAWSRVMDLSVGFGLTEWSEQTVFNSQFGERKLLRCSGILLACLMMRRASLHPFPG